MEQVLINISIKKKARNLSNSAIQKVSMFLLAVLPMLAWYAIPFPVGLGYAIVLVLSVYAIVLGGFKINILPKTFWLVYLYVFFDRLHQYGFTIANLLPPAGWPFFVFSIALVWGVLTFDLKLLRKYMRWVVIVSGILFWIQFVLLICFGHNVICFVPNLTGTFTYEDLTYAEIVQIHLGGERPCSIFLEKSYMAYYYVSYLAIYWFGDELKNKWYNGEIIFIVLTLVALKSGSGMVGLAVLCAVKVFRILFISSFEKKILLVLFMIPVLTVGINKYVNSEAGQEMVSRSDEFSTVGSSGFVRVISGYLMFEQLNTREQLVGIPNIKERFSTTKNNGLEQVYANGLQTILLTLGYIGLLWYILFYSSLFRKVSLSSKMSIIILLVMSLLESNYLNAYMMLLTIIPCADYYKTKKIQK